MILLKDESLTGSRLNIDSYSFPEYEMQALTLSDLCHSVPKEKHASSCPMDHEFSNRKALDNRVRSAPILG